jgi:nicotinate phosphoribosyltransferase
LYRFLDNSGKFYRDAIALETENPAEIDIIYHPVYPELNTKVKGLSFEILLSEVVKYGEILLEKTVTN